MSSALIINQAFTGAPAWAKAAMNGRSDIYLDTSALLNKISHISWYLGADSHFIQVLPRSFKKKKQPQIMRDC